MTHLRATLAALAPSSSGLLAAFFVKLFGGKKKDRPVRRRRTAGADGAGA